MTSRHLSVIPNSMDQFTGTGLTCVRGDHVVFTELDFAVDPGDVLVLSGPNGSGKTSLLRVMAGIAKPAAGKILWRGQNVADEPEKFFANIHYIGHRNAVKMALTVRENLTFYCALRPGVCDIDGALEEAGLGGLANLPARMLSAGQARRLALARIHASPATIWLLDEPTATLDGLSVERINEAIVRHRSQGGIVITSTNLPVTFKNPKKIDLASFSETDHTVWGDLV